VLTAYHVVEDGKTIKVRCQGYELVTATLGERSRVTDLAVLQLPLSNTPYLTLADVRSAKSGDSVFAIGFPAALALGSEPKFSEGSIGALSGSGREALHLLTSIPIQPGSSGSPLLAPDGSVVGIVTATTEPIQFVQATGALPQNLNWAVKAEYARPLYDQPTPRPPAGSRREAIQRASQAVCLVLAGP
jgi:S1-C subfamily serine protease